MGLFKKKKNTKTIIYSWATLFILVVFSGILLFGVVDIIKKSRETTKNKAAALKQLATLEEQEIQLQSEIGNLKTEEGIEENIRDRFFMVKEGEEFIVIVDDEAENQNQDTNKKGIGFIQFFKNIFSKE